MLRRFCCISRLVPTAGTTLAVRSTSHNPQLEPHDVIGPCTVAPTSKWSWPFCQQFVDIVHNPMLSLHHLRCEEWAPTWRDMLPPMRMFAQLPVGNDGKIDALEPLPWSASTNRSPHCSRSDPDEQVEQLVACLLENPSNRKVDLCAISFLQLCGFDTVPFRLDSSESAFRVFGKPCQSDSVLAAVTPNNDVVLIFGDKSLDRDAVSKRHGHVGQIVAEMLQLLSVHPNKDPVRHVFAVRLINYCVTLFRLDVSKQTLRGLTNTCAMPSTKLQLICSDADPMQNDGLSLIDPNERLMALQLMSGIRQFILK